MKRLLLPLLLGFSVPAIAHNEFNGGDAMHREIEAVQRKMEAEQRKMEASVLRLKEKPVKKVGGLIHTKEHVEHVIKEEEFNTMKKQILGR